MTAKLTDINNILFEQIQKINNDDLSDEELDKQIKKSETINRLTENIIRNGELTVKVVSMAAEYGFVPGNRIPKMLGVVDEDQKQNVQTDIQ